MTNTTYKKRKSNTRAKRRSGTRTRTKKGGSSVAVWIFILLLIAVLSGVGIYVYKNGNPFQPEIKEVVDTTVIKQSEKSDTVTIEKKETSQSKKRSEVIPVKKRKHKETDKLVSTTYKTYYQNRWGYKVTYPSFLTQQIQSENNDGCHFADYHGIEFITYGYWNVGEKSIKDLYKEKLDDGKKATYKRLFKKENYFIKFGYTKDGRMFYMKQVIATKLKGAPVITGILYFPPEYKKGSEEVIRKMFTKFPY